MVTVSRELKVAIKLGPKPAYKIAQQANISPSTLSKLICGIENLKPNDHRIVEVGKILGIPADKCFQEVQS